ncbi:hypothetical protein GCM10018793_35080 [Streptomyces sulfonofaciens]|uniref:IclR family transcriptional regulator n=1 Tax=Streptomyces sulfonofaciens TaxID=68272 RepID=A0A919L1U3_9ACTN|nr:helix-turn-helix domain-containing protein [Streptomyces sulfonofaciens]GHH80274.1 hypothetical protein GCM10018793_35080 [Streptomyces sulfonofaciens]
MESIGRQDGQRAEEVAQAAPGGGSTRAVERALGLLGQVCADGGITLTECARRVGVPTSTALRLLRTLDRAGFVTRRRGVFEAGPRLLQLGAQAVGRQGLVRLSEPVLRELVRATGESAYLSMLGPDETAVCVAAVEGTHPVRHVNRVGRSVPLADTAVGMALSGASPPEGYVARRESLEPDVTAIAAAIGRPGGIAGVLSLLGPTFRIDDGTLRRYGALVAGAAQGIAAQFGRAAAAGRAGI